MTTGRQERGNRRQRMRDKVLGARTFSELSVNEVTPHAVQDFDPDFGVAAESLRVWRHGQRFHEMLRFGR